ncbi:MAG: hypothetical protein KC910_37550, partial [Candidatus Eremiobacteraeota bacterium]|nr:hypothetical protein [Candidatus Eremiobacteraeota bacterium]
SRAHRDGRNVGEEFLQGIVNHSTSESERTLARVAREAAAQRLYNKSAFMAQAEALREIKHGIGGDSSRALAEWGKAARLKAYNNEDARKLMYPVLEAIGTDGDPRVAALGDVGRKASGAYLYQDSGSIVQAVALSKVLEAPVGPTLETDLADYGRRALNHCGTAQDQRNVGHEVLRGIKKYAQDPANAVLAKVADEATCPRLYHRGAAGAHYEAFALLEEGNHADADDLVARFGLAVLGRNDAASDRRTIVGEVLKSLAEGSSDEVKEAVLRTTLEAAERAGQDSVALGLQKFALNWVRKAPTLPKGQLEGGDELDPAVLEQRLAYNQSVRNQLGDEIKKNQDEVTARTSRMGA